MRFTRSLLTCALLAAVARRAEGQSTAAAAAAHQLQGAQSAYVVRLGRDTTGVERIARSAGRIEAEGLVRQPRTGIRHIVADYAADGRPTRVEVTLSALDSAGASTLLQRTVATFTRDSVVAEIRRDTSVVTRRLAAPPGILPVAGGAVSSWFGLDQLALRLKASRADSIAVPVYVIGAPQTGTWNARKLGRDSVWLYDGNDVFHARVDGDGHILGAIPLSGTQQFTVERVANADVQALARAFALRDARGNALGLLSPRDTVNATVAGAALWVDYGRPAKRGRVIFGSTIVPWGAVWRTGANAATQFRTDHALEMGGVTLPAGTYTLWTVPTQAGWQLLINSQTGQWGTEHDPARDIYRLDMRTATLPQSVERFTIAIQPEGEGGVLRFQWDTSEASMPFTVRP